MTEPHRKRVGRWKAGESGNPAGRKPGTGEVAAIRAAIAERVPELLAAMMNKALEGDTGAARLLLERAIAPLKAIEQTQAITVPASGTLSAQGRAVLSAVAGGALAPSQGAQLLAAIGSLARIIEIDELTARIITLEEKQNAKSLKAA
jgi:Family of unknown function (DUF5681)